MDTEHLVLLRWRDSDRVPFAAINADPVVMEHFPSVQSADSSGAFVDRIEQHFADHEWGYWAIEIPGVAPFIRRSVISTLLDAPMVEIGLVAGQAPPDVPRRPRSQRRHDPTVVKKPPRFDKPERSTR